MFRWCDGAGGLFSDAAALLAKCRYTLQYTYPFAYYLESGSRKELVSGSGTRVCRGVRLWGSG